MDKVVFLGSNPSNASPLNEPFTHCKSRTVLEEWIPALGLTVDQVEFMNVADYKTPNNRPLTKTEIKTEVPKLAIELMGRVVVTLGKTAEKAMEAVCDDYCFAEQAIYEVMPKVMNLPHPSGLNRQLNDKEWVKAKLAETREQLIAALNRGRT